MEKIKLESRYSDVNTEIEMIPDNRGIVTTTGHYIRTTTNDSEDLDSRKIIFIDFEGGPVLSIGSLINEHKIKSIKAVYLLEFE